MMMMRTTTIMVMITSNNDDDGDAMSFFNRGNCPLKLKKFKRRPNAVILTKTIEL